jgi:hypothetical protein
MPIQKRTTFKNFHLLVVREIDLKSVTATTVKERRVSNRPSCFVTGGIVGAKRQS